VSLPTWKENNELRLRVRHDVSSSIHFIPKGYISLDSGRLCAYVSERRQIRATRLHVVARKGKAERVYFELIAK